MNIFSCPLCGLRFTGYRETECPECLMQVGLEDMATQSTPVTAEKQTLSPPPKPYELDGIVPGLEVLDLIGYGGMGAVYKARQTNLDRIVALKIIKPDNLNEQDFAERFRREAQTMARLNHPHIVTIYEFGQSENLFFLVMEYVEGVTLRHLIQTSEISTQDALAIVPEVCDALQFAHDQGVVHRDIKPENILVDRQGHVRIADFGLAKLLNRNSTARNLTRTGQVMGTPHYMAPEQVEQPLEVDHRADIYSLGVVLYEMLTGQLPMGRFEVPSQRVKVDIRLDEVVLRALEKSPEQRYQLASQVATDIKSLNSGVPISGFAGYADPDREKQYRIDVVVCAVATVFVSVAVAIGVVLTGDAKPLYGFCLNWLLLGHYTEFQSKPRVAMWWVVGATFMIHMILLTVQLVMSGSTDGYWTILAGFVAMAIGSASGEGERKKRYEPSDDKDE